MTNYLVRMNIRKKPPEGWHLITPVLDEIDAKMQDAVEESHEGKRKCEALWSVHKYHFWRSRFIYESYYKQKAISKELYDFCLKIKIADALLIAKWKKPGYENICSLVALQSNEFGAVSICRVPRADLPPGKVVQDIKTGCTGCAASDVPYGWRPITITRKRRKKRREREDDDEEDREAKRRKEDSDDDDDDSAAEDKEDKNDSDSE
eukprot:CAMPEP_0168528834 /NCGR_PEP_ID=MMETSP0405-20121227/13504_1 /TAXON_ID=498012 /ORGANISM="Trichosphaerium sp, Strain Am-I-7 wt" /LENGTH=206 /DNA_ID=CAMNT_0008552353 /DNA_START=38 /DNA_END=658 /DNA_ORIENTATION=+